jgi:hypothetical protein
MCPATHETSFQVYILVPDFNPLFEPYPRGLGSVFDRRFGGRSCPGQRLGHTPSSSKPCGRAAPRGLLRSEDGAGPGQDDEPGAAGGPVSPARCARLRYRWWGWRLAPRAPDVDGTPELGNVPDSVPGRGGRRPPPAGCDLSQPTSPTEGRSL